MNFEYIKSAFYFIAVLSALVIVHEWGHFFVAKLCKMRVDDFSLFFGPRLLRLGKRNGTEYNIRTIPLGGFVKIAGMEPEDMNRGTTTLRSKGTGTFLIGLSDDTLNAIKAEQVSEEVKDGVDRAVGEDGKLLEVGKEDLKTLLTTTLNNDERRYIQAVLAAENYRPDPDGYNQKPIWQRASVIFAGPFMSLFFGYLIFCIMGFTTGLPDNDNDHIAIGALSEGKPAALAGMKTGDEITAIDGKPVNGEATLDQVRKDTNSKSMQITVLREKKPLTFTLTPYTEEEEVYKNGKPVRLENGKIQTKSVGRLGFGVDQVWSRSSGIGDAIHRGNGIIYGQVAGIFSTIFSKHVGDNVGGIVTITRIIHEEGKRGPDRVLWTAAILSVSLGVMNLFPIPILDGGHLMLLAWEGLRRRRLTTREMASAQVFGLCVIGILFVLVMYNDIVHLPIFTHR